jgi:hypothetical protein
MKLFLCLILAAALAGVAMADVDVTGKWSGTLNLAGPNGETKETTALLVLKQTGAEITGTVGPNEEQQFPIQKGKIEADVITLQADHDGHTLTLDLKLVSGRITGEVSMTGDGQSMKAKLDVGRQK